MHLQNEVVGGMLWGRRYGLEEKGEKVVAIL